MSADWPCTVLEHNRICFGNIAYHRLKLINLTLLPLLRGLYKSYFVICV